MLADWHVEPDHPRTFDIDLAKQKLDAAGYHLDANGKRLDKEGKPIILRLVYPNTNDTLREVRAVRARSGTASSGIEVTPRASTATRSATSSCRRRRDAGTGQVRHRAVGLVAATPTRTRCSRSSAATQIGSLSDSQYCNPDYDKLYDQQLDAVGRASATATLAQMQNLIYDQAPYDILYYDANLDVYRNDRFAGWQNMPGDGHAVLHLRHAQLHAADGCDGRSRRRRRRRRPRRRRPSAAPARRGGAGRAGTRRSTRAARLEQLDRCSIVAVVRS